MISHANRSIALVAGAFLLAATAWAQLGTATRFDVPFAFEAGGMAMPAGQYGLVKSTDNVAVLRNVTAKVGVVTPWRQNWQMKPSEVARMVFLKTGDHYILKSGEIPGFIAEWRIDKHAMTIEAKAEAQEVVILARR